MKIKKGDKVIVIAGKNKGETGAIVRAFPMKNRVLIDGMNMVKRHRRKTAENRSGQIVDKPMSIHASNVMILDQKSGKGTRIRITRNDGARGRVAVKSGEQLT